MSEERPLTVAEVARWLSCSERTVEREIAAGPLCAILARWRGIGERSPPESPPAGGCVFWVREPGAG